VVEGPGTRFGCNMISTITNRGVLRFMVFRKNFSTPIMLAFLKRLLRSVRARIFLIIDRHPVHRSKAVDLFLEKHRERIERFFLPDYSPQLNPDELLNQETKSHAGRQRPRDQSEMMHNLRSHLNSTQKQPAKVAAFFQEEHVSYAAH
jgi:transposase